MHNYGKEKTVTKPESYFIDEPEFINNFSRQRAETELLRKKQEHVCKAWCHTQTTKTGRQRQEDNDKFRSSLGYIRRFRSQGYTGKQSQDKTNKRGKNTKNTFIFTFRKLKLHTTSRTTSPLSRYLKMHSSAQSQYSKQHFYSCIHSMCWSRHNDLGLCNQSPKTMIFYYCLVIKLFIESIFSQIPNFPKVKFYRN